jgi:hypothetical protein
MSLSASLIPGSRIEDYYGAKSNGVPKLNENSLINRQLGVGGDNPGRTLSRAVQTGLGARALSQTAFGNALEPQRQSAINRAVTLTDPGNSTALIDQYGKKAVADALEFSRVRNQALGSQGLGSGAATGSTDAVFNQAQSATNQFAGQILSSAGQVAALRDHLTAIGLGQDPELAALLAQLEGMMQNSVSARDAGRNNNGLASVLGGLAGSFLGGPGGAELVD